MSAGRIVALTVGLWLCLVFPSSAVPRSNVKREAGSSPENREAVERLAKLIRARTTDIEQARKVKEEIDGMLSKWGTSLSVSTRSVAWATILYAYDQALRAMRTSRISQGTSTEVKSLVEDVIAKAPVSECYAGIAGGAHDLLRSLRLQDAETANELLAQWCDFAESKVLVPSGPCSNSVAVIHVAGGYMDLGRGENAFDVCTAAAADPRTDSKGILLVKAAEAATKMHPPNWELALLTLGRAWKSGDIPSPDDHYSKWRLDQMMAEWSWKARTGPPEARVAGYLTLWRSGLTRRMATYLTEELHATKRSSITDVTAPKRRPAQVGEIVAEGSAASRKVSVSVNLTFPPDSPSPSGKWVFRMVARGTTPVDWLWLIDEVQRPAGNP